MMRSSTGVQERKEGPARDEDNLRRANARGRRIVGREVAASIYRMMNGRTIRTNPKARSRIKLPTK